MSGMCCEIGDWKEKTGLEILEEETAGQRPGHGHALIAAEFRDFLKEDSGDFTPRRRARTLLHDCSAKTMPKRTEQRPNIRFEDSGAPYTGSFLSERRGGFLRISERA